MSTPAGQALTLKSLLAKEPIQSRFDKVLGKKSEAFIGSLMSAVRQNPRLTESLPESVVGSAMIAATLDLPITPSLGMAFMVPYKNNKTGQTVAQFQMGWKGYVQLGLRTGAYKTMHATEVYEGQIEGENPFTGEIEFNKQKTSDKIIGYLFYFKLLSGFEKYTYMTVDQMKVHAREYSKSYREGYGNWVERFDDMALKTVVKQGLSKWGLLSSEMQTAVSHDQGVILDGEIEYPDNRMTEAEAEAEAERARNERLNDEINRTSGASNAS